MDLSNRDKKVLSFGTVFLFVFCVVEFICLPALDKKDKLERELAVQGKAIDEMQELRLDHRELDKKFDRQIHALSQRSKNFTLFSFLDSQASKTNVKKNVVYMKPVNQDKEKKGYRISKVKVKLKGVYLNNLVDFLYMVETSKNAVDITSLSLTRAGRDKDLLDAVIETQTLILKDV